MLRPAHAGAAVTPSDSAEVNFRALYVGIQGHVTVDLIGGGTNLTFMEAQGILPISVSKVYLTGTTATNIIGLK